jgi:uncharacterized protein YegP (UPF0339 family)
MKYRVEYNQGDDGQWYTSIRHANGQKLFTSEGYTRREAAVMTLENFVRGICQEFVAEKYSGDVLEAMYARSERDGQQ